MLQIMKVIINEVTLYAIQSIVLFVLMVRPNFINISLEINYFYIIWLTVKEY